MYGDSLNRYFYQSILNRPLCWQVFRACYHTMLWVYALKESAADEMNLMFGGKPISILRILSELQDVVTRTDMDQDSALILNAGVHLLKSASFYNYQKIINGFISVLKRYYRGTVIWKSTTAIHDQRELYSGCYRRFHTEQVKNVVDVAAIKILRSLSTGRSRDTDGNRGCLPFTRKTRKFWLENEITHTFPFETFQKL